jgi:hypothetical protein
MIEKAIDELEYLSQDDKTRQLYEEQLKVEFDYNSGIYVAFSGACKAPNTNYPVDPRFLKSTMRKNSYI